MVDYELEIEMLRMQVVDLEDKNRKLEKDFEDFKISYSFEKDSMNGVISNLLKWNSVFQKKIANLEKNQG